MLARNAPFGAGTSLCVAARASVRLGLNPFGQVDDEGDALRIAPGKQRAADQHGHLTAIPMIQALFVGEGLARAGEAYERRALGNAFTSAEQVAPT
jgi:hypothetical protein